MDFGLLYTERVLVFLALFGLYSFVLLEKANNRDVFRALPADNYMFKVKNKNSRTRCEICSELTLDIFHILF